MEQGQLHRFCYKVKYTTAPGTEFYLGDFEHQA